MSVSVVPSGSLSQSNVQAALVGLAERADQLESGSSGGSIDGGTPSVAGGGEIDGGGP